MQWKGGTEMGRMSEKAQLACIRQVGETEENP